MAPKNSTPLMKQYSEIKRRYNDAILLFRMGDFYETFFDDAFIVSKALSIVLTKRSTEKGNSNAPPLAGFPVKAKEHYISKLVKAGYKVAICEQLEDPKSAKGIVKRGVTEVITSGTILEDSLLKEREYNYVLSIFREDNNIYLAYIDISISIMNVLKTNLNDLQNEIDRIDPSEIIFPDNIDFTFPIGKPHSSLVFLENYAKKELTEYFEISNLDGFGLNESGYISACGGLLSYLKDLKMNTLPKIKEIKIVNIYDFALIDKMTGDTLEVLPSQSKQKPNLLNTIDFTRTTMGGRQLRNWIIFPLINKEEIYSRQEAIDELKNNPDTLRELKSLLSDIPDIERLLSKISNMRIHPYQLSNFKISLNIIQDLYNNISFSSSLLKHVHNRLKYDWNIISLINNVLNTNLDTLNSETEYIRKGYNKELDKLRDISKNAKEWIIKYQEKQRELTGISKLRIKYNNVFGYFIEVSRINIDKVPDYYVRKQTLVNAERFSTEELKKFEFEVLGAEDRIRLLERELYNNLLKELQQFILPILKVAHAIAELDSILSLTIYAVKYDCIKPQLLDNNSIYIKNGRHPVIEHHVEDFIPNDINLDSDNQIMLLTGPNMAGKSTYLREIGLLCILTQIGSFIPAEDAEIGIFDKILTRIGASDDLSKGISTFLAEMNETAYILHNATSKSLVLLDEIGRGTSTYDGMSLAWATIEYIHNNPVNNPITVFATHYHELTHLEKYLNKLVNYSLSVKEWNDKIIFLRKVVKHPSDRSYGIYVAKLAGMPEDLIKRSNEILEKLEEEGKITFQRLENKGIKHKQLDLFDKKSQILSKIKSTNINNMTPIESLNFLKELIDNIDKIN